MKKTLIALAMATSTILSSSLHAAPSAEDRAAQLQADFQARIAAIQDEAARLKGDRPSDIGVVVGIDCDVKMGRQEIKLHLPEVKMVLQKWVYDLPEFFWGITSIGPVKLHLPQTRMKRHETKLHVPEFRMELQTIKLDVPEFYCKDAKAEVRRINGRGQALAAEGQALAEKLQRDLRHVQVAAIEGQRETALKQFDDAVAGLQAWINEVNNRKGNTAELSAKLQQLMAQRESVRKSFEDALRQLS